MMGTICGKNWIRRLDWMGSNLHETFNEFLIIFRISLSVEGVSLSKVPQAGCSSEFSEKDSDEIVVCKDWSCFRISNILETKKSLKASAYVNGQVKLGKNEDFPYAKRESTTWKSFFWSPFNFSFSLIKKLVLALEIRSLTLSQLSLYISLWTISLVFL